MITLFSGTDPYRIRDGLESAIIHEQATYPDASLTRIDCASPEGVAALSACMNTRSLFDTHSIVVATNILAADAPAQVILKGEKRHDLTLFCVHTSSGKSTAAERKQLATFAKHADVVLSYEPLVGQELLSWIQAFCMQRGCLILTSVSNELIRRSSTDTWALANELEKLCAYTTQGSITIDTVRLLVADATSQDEWELANALAARQKRSAVVALFKKIHAGVPEPLLLGTIASSIRNLIMIRDLTDRGMPSATIAKTTGLHPFVVSKHLPGARSAPLDALQRTLQDIATADRHMKSGVSDPQDRLFSIILQA